LLALATNVNQPVPSSELLTSIWGDDYATDLEYLALWMRRLQRKLEPNPDAPRIITGDVNSGFTLRAD
jgi:DNA-binding response OmpR family regulator